MAKKIKVGVLFGGRSAEHEVSLVSATSVMKNLDRKKYEVVPIGITKSGEWIAGPRSLQILASGIKHIPPTLRRTLIPAQQNRGGELVPIEHNKKSKIKNQKLDVIFPVLHGTFGEDGTVQGMMELANVPYVGCGVLGSAMGMDKIAQKLVYKAEGIPTPAFDYFTSREYKNNKTNILRRLNKLGFPVFVKPANLGSSVGISKVKKGIELAGAIRLALRYDRRVIVEVGIPGPMEIEVAILGNDSPKASVPGQVVSSNEFYDYNAKYVDGMSKAIIPAPLPKSAVGKIQKIAIAAFKSLDLTGMARVDFLVNKRGRGVYLNEVNTIPGFTSISMYPKLWGASGLTYSALLDKLINLALERHNAKKSLATTYKPKSAWYRS